ncbi:MAG TPA: hypothetical protein VJ851_09740 [Jatrophihabitans sp.]|nr:hypothetical protein [Jatrophihabitans sp.]
MAEISRRALFGGGLLAAGAGIGALLGLTRSVHHRVAIPPPPPPAALTAALASQRNLLAGYQQDGLASLPAGPTLRSDVRAHGDALLALLELYPGWRLSQAGSAGPSSAGVAGSEAPSSSAPPPATVAALVNASRTAAAALAASCLHWPVGEPHAAQVVPVLGSIAACLDSHVQVLSG